MLEREAIMVEVLRSRMVGPLEFYAAEFATELLLRRDTPRAAHHNIYEPGMPLFPTRPGSKLSNYADLFSMTRSACQRFHGHIGIIRRSA